jgi:hypothetical protein
VKCVRERERCVRRVKCAGVQVSVCRLGVKGCLLRWGKCGRAVVGVLLM